MIKNYWNWEEEKYGRIKVRKNEMVEEQKDGREKNRRKLLSWLSHRVNIWVGNYYNVKILDKDKKQSMIMTMTDQTEWRWRQLEFKLKEG